jgi:hypothetical protein
MPSLLRLTEGMHDRGLVRTAVLIVVASLPVLEIADLIIGQRHVELDVLTSPGIKADLPRHGQRGVTLLRPGDLYSDESADVSGIGDADITGGYCGTADWVIAQRVITRALEFYSKATR